MPRVDDLHVVPVDGDRMLEERRHVHNLIVPPDELSPAEVRERSGRHRLENAYLGDELVGCSTVRPPRPSSRACCPSTVGADSVRRCTSTAWRTRAGSVPGAFGPSSSPPTPTGCGSRTEVWLTLRLEG
jgi:hypothetical protein